MKHSLTLSLLMVCLTATPGFAAELVLRSQATELGPIVRLGDVADISAASPAMVRRLATTPLFPAPAGGKEFFLTVEKLRDLLNARGVDVGRVKITGSLVVQVGGSSLPSPIKKFVEPVKEIEPEQKSEADIKFAVKRAVEQRLLDSSTVGHWRVELPLTKYQLKNLQSMESDLTAHELQRLRSGRVRFQISDGKQDWQISADITQIQSVVVAKQSIERGQLVRAVDVEVRQREGNLPNGSMADLQRVVGQIAQRHFKADDVLQKSYLRAPWKVRRGETVNTFVRTGNIVVRTRAIAKQNGAMGDLILVETVGEKQQLDVTVSGPSEVTVYATGGRIVDYASLNGNDRLRR